MPRDDMLGQQVTVIETRETGTVVAVDRTDENTPPLTVKRDRDNVVIPCWDEEVTALPMSALRDYPRKRSSRRKRGKLLPLNWDGFPFTRNEDELNA